MREEEQTNYFSYWEDQADQLPSPEELTPITQTLITADLANAFSIKSSHNPPPSSNGFNPPPLPPSSNEFNPPPLPPSSTLTGSPKSDEPARTLKRPRLIWTPELHKQFVGAVDHLGLKNAVPKEILQVMGVEGLTRDKVASHLQKYRLYLRRMRHLLDSSGVSIAKGGQPSPCAPVLQNFLECGGSPPCGEWSREHCLPFMPTDVVLQHQQHQMAAAVPQQHVMQHQHGMGLFGLPANEQTEHGFLERQQQEVHSMVPSPVPASSELAYVEDLEPVARRERKLLRLFPTCDD